MPRIPVPAGRPEMIAWWVAADLLDTPRKDVLHQALRGEFGAEIIDNDLYMSYELVDRERPPSTGGTALAAGR